MARKLLRCASFVLAIIAFMIGLQIEPRKARAATLEDPYPNSESTPACLTIYYPQDGAAVPEIRSWDFGAFTLANLNDTDGNGQPDNVNTHGADPESTDPVRNAISNLTDDVSGGNVLQIEIADIGQFADTVNGSPNRVRVIDDNGSELVYVSSVDAVTGRIYLMYNTVGFYTVAAHGRVEIGEVDLMRLVVDSPSGKPENGTAFLHVSPNLRLWRDECKGGENYVTPDSADEDGSTWYSADITSLPVTLWVECFDVSPSVRGDWVHLIVEDGGENVLAEDEVSVTGIWAERTHFWKTAAAGPSLNGDADGYYINLSFANMGSALDMGTWATRIGGRIQQEFTLYPADVGAESDVTADVTRQGSWVDYSLTGAVLTELPGTQEFPTAGWNMYEIATDDSHNHDEDNVPLHDHIYSVDAPSSSTAHNADSKIARETFHEFVRFKFGDDSDFGYTNFYVVGSRGSDLTDPDLTDWHYLLYVSWNGTIYAPAAGKPNEVNPTWINIHAAP